MNADHLGIFCKAPRPGTVKTRIASHWGVERATSIYRELARRTFDQAAGVPDVTLFFSPDDASPEIESWRRRSEWSLRGQGDGDLGARLVRAFESLFQRGAHRVVIVGTDAPEIAPADFREGFRALHSCDVVLGPAADGGYWMVGLKSPQPALFSGIAWSTPLVLNQTLHLAKAQRLSVVKLRVLEDIDTPSDWESYQLRNEGRS